MKSNANYKKYASMIITVIIVLSIFLPAASSQFEDTSDNKNIITIETKNLQFPILLQFLQKIIDYFQQKPIFHRIVTRLTQIKTKYTLPTESTNEIYIINPTESTDLTIQEKSLFPLNARFGNWTVGLIFSETGGSYDVASFGEKTDASDGLDSYDVPKNPPGMTPYIRGSFTTPFASPYGSLWEEYKKHPDSSKVWNLTIQWIPSDYSSPTTMTITWNIIDVNASGYSSVILYDVGNNINVADMLNINNYVFTCPALTLQTFEIRCAQNQNPTAFDDSATVDEDSLGNQIDVLANDTDPDGDNLSITTVSTPNNGSTSTDGQYVYYTPNVNFNGLDTFTYEISDGNSGADIALVNITVNPQNDNPIANNDTTTVLEDSISNQIDVLLNDVDPEGDNLTIQSVTSPSHGSSSTDGFYVFYTPTTNYYGLDSFTYIVNDGNGGTDNAIITITISPVNDPPVANDDYATVAEDSSNNNIDTLANDYDIESDDLNITAVTTPLHGSATYSVDYVFYTPDPDYTGSDQVNYTISDGNGGTDTATIYITVTAGNDPPIAINDSAVVIEDSSDNQIIVLINDIDPDGDDIDITGVTTPLHGSATYSVDYVFYTPDLNYTGSDQFDYSITDNNGGSDSATIFITVGGTNDPPTANDDLTDVDEDSSINEIDVLVNDNDPDGDTLEIVAVTQPSQGLVLFTPNFIYYNPPTNYNGLAQCTYTISDGNGGYDNATVFIVVNALNDPPTANDDTATILEDSSNYQIDVLVNDNDIDGDNLDITNITMSSHGTVTYTTDHIYYTANVNYNGPDQLNYTISDGNGGTDNATVYVTISPVNDPPTALDDNVTVIEDSGNNIIFVLANDYDIDGDTVTIINISTPIHGTASFTSSFVTYTPDSNYDGIDLFDYTISDTNGSTDIATVYINVTGENDLPNASSDFFTVIEDSMNNELNVLTNDNDPDGDNLIIISVTQPIHGIASYTLDYIYYTPNPDYIGSDAFSYDISDGNGGTDSAAIFIDVIESNDPPNVPSNPNPQNGSIAIPFNATLSWVGGDPDGDIVSYNVYIGMSTPPAQVANNITDTTYDPGILDDDTTYYWRIIAWDNHSTFSTGPVWEFTTAQNHPPFIPRDPEPQDGAVLVDPEIIFQWTGNDPDQGDIVTYDLYLDTQSPPVLAHRNISEASYDPPGELLNWTTYYWRIVSWDYHQSSTIGPIWSFTTSNLSNKPPSIPTIEGPKAAGLDIPISFTSLSTDKEKDGVFYKWDWGDGNVSDWLGPFASGQPALTNHTWYFSGDYIIRVKAKDTSDEESDWSEPYSCSISPQINFTQPLRGYIYFQLFIFENSFAYIGVLDLLGVTIIISTTLTLDLEVNATNATDTVEFIAHNSIWNLSFDATDSDGTDGFSTIMEGLEMGIYQLQANAYDEEGYLIDEASSLLLYLALGA